MIGDTELVQFFVNLTRQQRKVLQLTAEGLTNPQIAEQLTIKPSVVGDHLTNIYGELSCLDGLESISPRRYVLVRLFASFFDRHPELSQF